MANAARDKETRSLTGQLWPPLHAWMSQAALAEYTELDRKTIGPALARLESLGFIARAGSEGETRQIPVYLLRAKVPENGTLDEAQKDPESGSVSGAQAATESTPVSDAKDPVIPGEGSRFSRESTPKTGHGYLLNPEGTQGTQEKKTRVRAPSSPPLDDVDPQVWADWLAVRKAKRGGPVTQTEMDGLRRDAGKVGISIEDAVRFCVEANWERFKVGWYADRMANNRGGSAGDLVSSADILKSWEVERLERSEASLGEAFSSTSAERLRRHRAATGQLKTSGGTLQRLSAQGGIHGKDYSEGVASDGRIL